MSADKENTVMFDDIVNEPDAAKRDELIARLVSQMTLDEKLFQMGGAASLKTLTNYGSAVFPAGGCKRLGVPKVKFTDGPRGVMLNSSTCFPVSMARGATWDPELEERVGSVIGTEARAQGANLAGSVCINLPRHPGWGRAQETYGEDPVHLGEMGSALARGMQRHIMACVKHYAVNSIENSRFWVDVLIEPRTLHEVYLPHFKKCIDGGIACVMAAYNRMNGPHCCHSPELLTDILRGQWGFDGYVISDWTFGLRGSDAAPAGLDIEMPNAVFFGRPLKNKVKSGKIPESVIDTAVARIIRTTARFATVKDDSADYSHDSVACKTHTNLALEVARKSIVLLKNEFAMLPLDREKINTIAVIGEFAKEENIGDRGSSNLRPPYVVTILEGIQKLAGEGVKIIYDNGKNLSSAKRAARSADAAIVVAGLGSDDEGEFIPILTKGGDREDLSLPRNQDKLIKAVASENGRTAVVLEGGSAITMENWVDDVPAILMAWYPGMEGGNAVAEVLFGDVNPGGKLPITFPKSEKQLPKFSKWTRRIEYEFLHGYRKFDAEGLEPRFAFGHGLSYTTFEYANLRVEPDKVNAEDPAAEIKISVDVKNTGDRAGDEVVMLFAGFPESKVIRPPRELKAFRRVTIQPGETKTVTLPLPPRDLAYYDPDLKDWVIEKAKYDVMVGEMKSNFRL